MAAPSSRPASSAAEPRERPSLQVVGPAPPGLPVERTLLIGRDAEIAAVRALLARDDVGLVTLTGIGGSGKTRLAIAAAADLGDAFPGGVWFVDLTVVGDAGRVADAVASVLAVRGAPGRSTVEQIVATLRDADALLVLDNFEHVIAAAGLVGELLAGCPGLKVLATSREVLRLRDEHELPVPPLGVPDLERVARAGVSAALVPAIARFPAVALFVERARAVTPSFALTPANAAAVVEICRRLDGLPLAIELAASRVRLLPPEAILARLEHRLDLLTGGPRDRPERQQTLRATIAWSYDLLEPAEQALFRRLAVFAGGFTIEAAAAVAGGAGRLGRDILEGLDALIAKSLVRAAPAPTGEPRYTLLESVREFGLERLAAAGETDAARQGQFGYCLALAERAGQGLTGPDQAVWLDQVDLDFANIRAGVTWAIDRGFDTDGVLRLLASLTGFWFPRTDLREPTLWLAQALDLPGASPDQRAKALNAAGNLALGGSDHDRAVACFQASLALFREAGDALWEGRVLGNIGIVAAKRGDCGTARSHFEASLAALRPLGDLRGTANAMVNVAVMLAAEGDMNRAVQLNEEAIGLFRRIGDFGMEADTLENLGGLLAGRGDLEAAWGLFSQTLDLRRAHGHRRAVGKALGKMASIAHARGRLVEAVKLVDESLHSHQEIQNADAIADCVTQFAVLAGAPITRPLGVAASSPSRPARLDTSPGAGASHARLMLAAAWLAAADAIRDATGTVLEPNCRTTDEANHADLRAALGASAYEAGRRRGCLLSLEQACDEVHAFAARVAAGDETLPALEPPAAARAAEAPDQGGLSDREIEVARLIAAGRTYRQIAGELSVSQKTVEKHVGNILGKLGLANRSQVAVWVAARRKPDSPAPL